MAIFGEEIPSQGIAYSLLGYSLKKEYLGEAFNFRNVETFDYEFLILDTANITTNANGETSLSSYINTQMATRIGTDKKNINITSIEIPNSMGGSVAEDLIRIGTYRITLEVRNRIGEDVMWLGYCYNPTNGTCSNNAFNDDENGCITDAAQCADPTYSTQLLCQGAAEIWTPNTWNFDDHNTSAECGNAGGSWKNAQHTELDPNANTATTKQYNLLHEIFEVYGPYIDSINENISIDEDNQKNKTITHSVNVEVRHATEGEFVVQGIARTWTEEDPGLRGTMGRHQFENAFLPWHFATNIAELLFRSMDIADLGKYVFAGKVDEYNAHLPLNTWWPMGFSEGQVGGNNRYTETYDDLNRKYSFTRKQKILKNNAKENNYSTNVKHTIAFEKNGIVTITEDLVLEGKNRGIADPITKYIQNEKNLSWDRCSTVLQTYSAQAADQPQYVNFLIEKMSNGGVVKSYNEQPISQNVAFNIQDNAATITTIYSNSPKLTASSVDGNLSIEVDDRNISTVSYDVNFKLFPPKRIVTDQVESGDKTPIVEVVQADTTPGLLIWPVKHGADPMNALSFKDPNWFGVASYTYSGHTGMDIGAIGTSSPSSNYWYPDVEVVAAADGEVVAVVDGEGDQCTTQNFNTANCGGGCAGGNCGGNHVVIDHDPGGSLGLVNSIGYRFSSSCHMKKNSITVTVGDVVAAGDKIGMVGSSGQSTGPHLHWEIGRTYSGSGSSVGWPVDPYFSVGNHGSNRTKSMWKDQDNLPSQAFVFGVTSADMAATSMNIIGLLKLYDSFSLFAIPYHLSLADVSRKKYHFPFSETTSHSPFGSASQFYHYTAYFKYRGEGNQIATNPNIGSIPTEDEWTLLSKTLNTSVQGKDFSLQKKWTNDPTLRVKTLPGCVNCFKKVESKIVDTWPKAMFSEHTVVNRDKTEHDDVGSSVMSYNYQTEVGKRVVTLTSVIPRRKWNQLLHSWNYVNEPGGPYVPANELQALAKEAKSQLLSAFQHTRLTTGFRITAYLSDLSYVFDSSGNVTLTAEMTYGIKSTDMLPIENNQGKQVLKDNIPLNYKQ